MFIIPLGGGVGIKLAYYYQCSITRTWPFVASQLGTMSVLTVYCPSSWTLS